MNVTDIASTASAFLGSSPMDTVSGASSYAPAATTGTDSALAQMRSDLRQNSQDFKALKSALKTNDLAGATQAFATLSQDIQKASQASGGKSPFAANSAIGKDFKALGEALQAGDLSAAKQAFASFKNDIKTAGHSARAQAQAAASAASAANDGDADDGVSPASTATVGGTLNTTA
jgi:hypothetical protein